MGTLLVEMIKRYNSGKHITAISMQRFCTIMREGWQIHFVENLYIFKNHQSDDVLFLFLLLFLLFSFVLLFLF